MILIIPDELKDEFHTFLEVGLASVTAYPDAQLTQKEQCLISLLQDFLDKGYTIQFTGTCRYCGKSILWDGIRWKHALSPARHSPMPTGEPPIGTTGVCHYCGRNVAFKNLTMDHLVPLARGGRSTKDNLVPCCKACNTRKKSMLPLEWEEYVEKIKG